MQQQHVENLILFSEYKNIACLEKVKDLMNIQVVKYNRPEDKLIYDVQFLSGNSTFYCELKLSNYLWIDRMSGIDLKFSKFKNIIDKSSTDGCKPLYYIFCIDGIIEIDLSNLPINTFEFVNENRKKTQVDVNSKFQDELYIRFLPNVFNMKITPFDFNRKEIEEQAKKYYLKYGSQEKK